MKNYYIDPLTRNLVVYDIEAEEIRILEKIEKVRMFTVSEVKLGDFDGRNPDDVPDKFDKQGGYRNSYLHEGGNYPKHGDATRGKRRKRAAGEDGEPKKKRGPRPRLAMTPQKIEQIKRLHAEGKGFREIGEIVGTSFSSARKYSML